MSLISDSPEEPSLMESFIMKILKVGEIPSHVAFIMDGNRRFARKSGDPPIKGHEMGFKKLAQTLKWCHDLNIKEVTVYAFSIENYKRSEDEVQGLMELSRQRFRQIIKEKDKFKEHGVRIRVLGDLGLLPQDLQELISQAMEVTKENSNCTLNVALSYTSRRELSQAIKIAAQAVKDGRLKSEDITDDLLERCLYTRFSKSTDLLIRTSGEVRLSDFLLWQSSWSVTYFTSILWPDFTLKHLMAGIFYYQRNKRKIEWSRNSIIDKSDTKISDHSDKDERIAKFIQELY